MRPLLTKCNEKSLNNLRDTDHTPGEMCDTGSCVRDKNVICTFTVSDGSGAKTDNLRLGSFRKYGLYLLLSWGILGLLSYIILVMSKLQSNLNFTMSRVSCHVVYVSLTKFNYFCLTFIFKTELELWEEYNMLISNLTVLFLRLTLLTFRSRKLFVIQKEQFLARKIFRF